jgi:hypothetical protein
MMYDVMQGSRCVHSLESNGEPVSVRRRKEPSSLGTAAYDPLIDVPYEQLLKVGHINADFKRMAEAVVARAGGMEKVAEMRRMRS